MEGQSIIRNAEHLKCFICLTFYTEPKTLPCLHSFCETCILNCSEKKIFNCPLCWKAFVIQPNDLKTNGYLQNMIDLFETLTDSTNHECSFCKVKFKEIKPANSRCLTCLEFLCKECAKSRHAFNSFTMHHHVVSLSEIRSGKYYEEIRSAQCKTKCTLHPNRVMEYFCISCEAFACCDCKFLQHKNHKVKLMSDLRTEKENIIKNLSDDLKFKLSTLQEDKKLIDSRRDDVSAMKIKLREDIMQKCSEAVSKIDRKRNKMLQDLEGFAEPRIQSLQKEDNRLSKVAKNIEESLHFYEIMQNGNDYEVFPLFEKIQERFQSLKKESTLNNSECLLEECLPQIGIHVTEPELELTYNDKITDSDLYRESGDPSDNSDSSSSEQASDDDEETESISVTLVREIYVKIYSDSERPVFSGIAWINNNKFVTVDKANEKIIMYSLSSGKILKSIKNSKALAVSVWKNGISCLSTDNVMLDISRDFNLRDTRHGISSLCATSPSLNQMIWVEKTTIYSQNKNAVKLLPVKNMPEDSHPCFLRHACCLPNGLFAVSDTANQRVYLIKENGIIFKTRYCNPGSIAFDKYDNIFISDYDRYCLVVFDMNGVHKADLYIDEKPRSISILENQLLVAAGHKILLYHVDLI
ncbi:E3 ubiquitin-protein ligase TRIM56-like [Saccostrea echinata]|uniref:E3 ubiquitin-protein ligase TRIM56-like n=1 Tax=Saccostrea echinata TaxID=191078 RepID=UPI002A80737B|nr:E3 ubiquitin-protein ligase TRIM56-like [Saccostrea echinata]